MRVHIQPLLFSPILDTFWMFAFHVNHMVVRLVSNLCNFPSVPCLKIKTFFVINFTSLKLKYSLQPRSDYLKWPVCSFHQHIQLHNSSHQQSHCIWNMQAVEAGTGSFVEGTQNFLSKFNSTKGTCVLSQKKDLKMGHFIFITPQFQELFHLHGVALQHSAWCNSFRAVLHSEVDWGQVGSHRKFWAAFVFASYPFSERKGLFPTADELSIMELAISAASQILISNLKF